MHPRMKQCLDQLESASAVPKWIGEIMESVESADTTPDDLAVLVERDRGMAQRLLDVANSALYSFSGEIESTRHAITLLGFDTVRTLATADALRELFSSFSSNERLIWEHSVVCGIASARLAQKGIVEVEPADAFTVGLLHDVGKIALVNTFRAEYARVSARVEATRARSVDAENAQFGFDHAALGAEVLGTWDIGEDVRCAIRHHHAPERLPDLDEGPRRLAALAMVVSSCALRLGVGRVEPVGKAPAEALFGWQALGLSVEARDSVFKLISEAVRRGRELIT